MSKIGPFGEEADDDWTKFGDHHAYPHYVLHNFDDSEARALAKDKANLTKLIKEKIG